MARYKRRFDNGFILCTLLIFALMDTISCYEKTLRKIVRDQSKMVQRPFDGLTGILMLPEDLETNPRSGSVRTMLLHTSRPVLPMMDSQGSIDGFGLRKSFSRLKVTKPEKPPPQENRSTRNINTPQFAKKHRFNMLLFGQNTHDKNGSTQEIAQRYKKLPLPIFPPVDESELQTIEETFSNESIIFPVTKTFDESKSNDSLFVKGIFRTKATKNFDPTHVYNEYNIKQTQPEFDNRKFDYFMEVPTTESPGGYNITLEGHHICAQIKTMQTNIEAQKRYHEFDIEPPWMSKKHYWNNIYNSRYEYLMRSSRWPPLKVILVPHSHVDTIWKNTFEYYSNNAATKILSNIVKKLNFYSNLTFTWNEISHLNQWWKTTTPKNRANFRKYLKGGRLEITTGGWVESDEATTHIFGLTHILIEGHQWLTNQLSYAPEVAWLTNTVTHSPTMTYLLSTLGITKLVFTNVHYSWEEYLAEYQISDFVWVQNWLNDAYGPSELDKVLKRIGKDRYPKNSVFSHYLQFNSNGFEACGPNRHLCNTEFNFVEPSKLFSIHKYNVKNKAELLLEQYSKTGTLTPHNIVIAPIGGPQHFTTQPEIDFQYNNYLKLADFINYNRDIYRATVEFGTPLDYFKSVFQMNLTYPTLKGDFLNFADVENGRPAYWTGFFTSRPLLKILLRRIQSTLRSTEILFSFAITHAMAEYRDIDVSNITELLTKSRETVAQLLDRNVVSGTLSAKALRYVYEKIILATKNCWQVQEMIISTLTSNKPRKKPYLRKYVYRQGEFISVFRTVNPGDYVLLFNSLSQERYEIVELFTRSPNIRIVDHRKNDITVQINPVWKYNSRNVIIISKRFYKVIFAVFIPPLTIELVKIKGTLVTTHNIATIYCLQCTVEKSPDGTLSSPFNIQPIEKGDIQLENYKHRLVFDETSGLLKSVITKDSNTEKRLMIDYGAFTSSYINSGIFLFNTNITNPVQDLLLPYRTGLKSKTCIIVTGQLTTEFTSVYGRLLQHTVKIYNIQNSSLSSVIYVESKLDMDVSPSNRDMELFMSIQTDISNGNSPEIYTDNNGFQYTLHTVNMSRRIESNMYPMTTLSFIQDRKHRLTVVTDHAQGVTALQEGQLVLMLDRRVLYDDGRGTQEGLADSGFSCQRHYILLENFIQPLGPLDPVFLGQTVQLPSFRATYLSNTFNFDLDLFIVDKNDTQHCVYAFIPLIKAPYPCDVSLLNFRTILDGMTVKPVSTSVSLMILHRQSFTCRISYETLVHCNIDPKFSITNILRNARSVFKTNLAGTNKGTRLSNIDIDNFPPMELLTLRIHY